MQRSVAPFLEGQAGRRTLIISTVGLPIALGLIIFGVIVVMSARGRSVDAVAAGDEPWYDMATFWEEHPAYTLRLDQIRSESTDTDGNRLVVADVGSTSTDDRGTRRCQEVRLTIEFEPDTDQWLVAKVSEERSSTC